MTPNALVFDFDGLICDTEGCLVRAAKRVFDRHAVSFPIEKWLEFIGTSSPVNFWVPWLQNGVEAPLNEPDVLAEFDEYNTATIALLDPNPGVLELLDLAEAADIALAVASSSSMAWVGPLLEQLDLRHRFVHVLTRNDVTHAKPAPDLYVLAAERLSSDPAHCVALEDSHNGSMAAVRAGMPVVVVPNELTRHRDLTHATHAVDSLHDVTLDLLRDIRRRHC